MHLTRKRFLELGATIVAGQLLTLAGCGGDDDGGGAGSGGSGTGGSGTGGSGTGGGGTGGGGTGGAAGSGTGGAAGSGTGGSGTGGTSSGGAAGAASGGAAGAGTGGGSSGCAAIVAAAISQNHGHQLQIPLADIQAGVEKTYKTTGISPHCHQVTITAADFATLQGGGTVVKTSCNGTDHEYVISCAANPPPPGPPQCGGTPSLGTCT